MSQPSANRPQPRQSQPSRQPQDRTRRQAPNRSRQAAAPQSRSRSAQAARHARTPQRSSSKGPIVVILLVVIAAIVVGAVLFLTQCRGKQNAAQTTQTEQTQSQQTTNTGSNDSSTTQDDQSATKDTTNAKDANSNNKSKAKASWELTLVNKTHPLPEDWDIELEEVYEGKYVDARIAEQFKQMIEDCRAAGYDDVFVNQAYRSHEDQQSIWNEFYDQYLAEGYSEEEAEELTGESVAIPGTSEHELGLAADICSINFDEEYNAPIQTWLRENGYKYGFIQRYPEGKEDITGTKNENWHFRYVGVDAATEIHDSGQVLEEYLDEV